MNYKGDINSWRLATILGKMLDSMTPKWIRALEEIEKYVEKISGANINIVEVETEDTEEENKAMENKTKQNK